LQKYSRYASGNPKDNAKALMMRAKARIIHVFAARDTVSG